MDAKKYSLLYQESINNSALFWLTQAQQSLTWFQQPTQSCSYNWDINKGPIYTKWFQDGTLNISYNCLDRHALQTPNKTALIWQGEQEEAVITYTYQELLESVCACAHMLTKLGIHKGSRVALFLPMVPEALISMLACARIGAIHCTIFSGISSQALALRLQDIAPDLLITTTHALRTGKKIPLYATVTESYQKLSTEPKTLVIDQENHSHTNASSIKTTHLWWHEQIQPNTTEYPCTPMHAEDPLFILHTSGSTGKPKGLVHTSAGYLLYTMLTTKWAFDVQAHDIMWCTADIGWITGHSYGVYGPLANGATILMYESTPLYPTPHRCAHIIEKFGVTTFYTAPTVIRLLATHDHGFNKQNTRSLRILGSVGEVLDSATANWYAQIIGNNRCPIVDTWWQTETGGIMLAPLPFIHTVPLGSVGKPFFGITPTLMHHPVDKNNAALCFSTPWPGIARTIYNDHATYEQTYFTQHPTLYTSGDGAYIDNENNIYITGRIDDVINVSGHRISSAEIESAILTHHACCETAVVGAPHALKGSCLYAFIVIRKEYLKTTEELEKELQLIIRSAIGPIAKIDYVHITKELPKTRSGKIMRRILRKIVEGCIQQEELGDLSTIVNQECIAAIITERQNTSYSI